jgi:hypothetical protein
MFELPSSDVSPFSLSAAAEAGRAVSSSVGAIVSKSPDGLVDSTDALARTMECGVVVRSY